MKIERFGFELILCQEKAIYLPGRKTLLIADLHLGKITHFRRAGIGLPQDAIKSDYRELNDVIEKYCPDTIILMGDLFHAGYNSAWDKFLEFIGVFGNKEFILIKGNHDIMASYRYKNDNFSMVEDYYLQNLIITHEPLEKVPKGKYNLYGHIHPGVRVVGVKQSLRLPCFHFENDRAVLPAFGRFTGLAIISPKIGDDVYAIADNTIICLTDR